MHARRTRPPWMAITLLCWLLAACAAAPPPQPPAIEPPPAAAPTLPRLGYAIQAGAFENLDNAVRLTEKLQRRGLEAYYFIDTDRLYKVRFGNWRQREEAARQAAALGAAGILEEYFVVDPRTSPAARWGRDAAGRLREELVATALRFRGTPYRWGGASARTGFDCSGLTMAVYQLNGLELPRTSEAQWHAGKPVARSRLEKGDLVFFATSGGRRVSHVGIYTGRGRFLHAPGRGRTIGEASLDSPYFRKRFLGGRTYL